MNRKYIRRQGVFLQDEIVSALASLLSILATRWILSNPVPGFSTRVFIWLAAALLFSALGFLILGTHKDIRRFATVRSIGKALGAVTIKELGMAGLLLTGVMRLGSLPYGVMTVFIDFCLTGGALFYVRFAARTYSEGTSADVLQRATARTALVRGTDQAAIDLAHELEKEGYDVAGLLTTDEAVAGRVIADFMVYAVNTEEDVRRLQWRLGGVDGIFFPKAELVPPAGDEEEESQPDGLSPAGHVVKRGCDILLSGILLLVFSPVILACAIAIKREDGGDVIYAQERIGKDGKPFLIYKFRSMQMEAEKNGKPALYSGEDDPRLTKVGKFLRQHHLDELPQLWNVFIGDMSFIGYRPERAFYIEQIMRHNARYRYLYQIKPGITSYATLYNGYTDSMEKMLTRLDLDLYYLRNHSLWFDAKVLGLTFLSIVSGKKF